MAKAGGGSISKGGPGLDRRIPSRAEFKSGEESFGNDPKQLDLFPSSILEPRRAVGRPEFKKTKQNQQLVEALLRHGASRVVIARAVGCSEPTLRKHFRASKGWIEQRRGKGAKTGEKDS